MKSPQSKQLLRTLPPVLALLGAASFWACEESGSPATYLIAKVAGSQPQSESLGRIVIVQTAGGQGLRVRTEGGTHSFGDDVVAVSESCLAPSADRLSLIVHPADREALVYLDLLNEAPAEGAGLGGAGADCTGEVVANLILPVPLVQANGPTPPATGGTDGGIGGQGGAS